MGGGAKVKRRVKSGLIYLFSSNGYDRFVLFCFVSFHSVLVIFVIFFLSL